MLGAMVLAMPAGPVGHLVAALALTVLTLALAPLARAHSDVHCVLLDLGAMSLVLAGLAMAAPASGDHAHDGTGMLLAVAVTAGWAVARLRITRGRIAAATGVLCAAQLAVMLLV
jgi:hypothetical protein